MSRHFHVFLKKSMFIGSFFPTGAPIAACFLVWAVLALPVYSENKTIASAKDLKKLSLEELMNVEVTTAGRRPQPLSEVATAIDVITSDDIRRSGARSLGDVLRLATGLHVARFDDRTWDITARGFNGNAANKMLVLMDGRNLYTPLFSGTHWDAQDYLFEDIDRIEVIRGPGATMWGANAVNGVINIITKHAQDTQGGFVSAGVGNEEHGFGSARYGGKIGEDTFYRAYLKGFNRDGMSTQSGSDAVDDWSQAQGGFRLDSRMDENDSFSFQGDIYNGSTGLYPFSGVPIDGGNIMGKWDHTFSDESNLWVQIYYDRTRRAVSYQYEEVRDTYDIEMQHRFPLGDRHDIVWGFNFRSSSDDIQNTTLTQFIPNERTIDTFSGFIQDEITLYQDRLFLILGSKFEHNDFTGFEIQPSARIAWLPTENQTLWASVSRAVRTPTRIEDDILFSPQYPVPLFVGNRDFKSEELLAYELGYRIQTSSTLSFDLAAFYNTYDRLRILGLVAPPFILSSVNDLDADTYGAEMEINYHPTGWWRLTANYTYLQEDFDTPTGGIYPLGTSTEANDPHHLAMLRSSMDLYKDVELDVYLRYVDELNNPYVPNYLEMDVRIGWQPKENIELSLVGRNLLDDSHPEFGQQGPASLQVERSIYGMVTWKF